MATSDGELRRSVARLYNGGQRLPAVAFARLLEHNDPTRRYWAFYYRNAVESGSGHAE